MLRHHGDHEHTDKKHEGKKGSDPAPADASPPLAASQGSTARDDHDDKKHGPRKRPHEVTALEFSVRRAKANRAAAEAAARRETAHLMAGTEVLRRARALLEAHGNPGMGRIELMDFRGIGFRCELVSSGWVMFVQNGTGQARIALLNNGTSASEWVHDDADHFEHYQFTRTSVSPIGWSEHAGPQPFAGLQHAVATLLEGHGIDAKDVRAVRDPG